MLRLYVAHPDTHTSRVIRNQNDNISFRKLFKTSFKLLLRRSTGSPTRRVTRIIIILAELLDVMSKFNTTLELPKKHLTEESG